MMKRRDFIRLTATTTGGIILLPNFLTAKSLFSADDDKISDNVLVFIQLNGGNDGLNTFIPFQDSLYYNLRPTIGIGKDKLIQTFTDLGFHPSLYHLAEIANEGNFTLIQNVGYPNPNRSHFRSQEIWQTASGSTQYLTQGWLGRFLDIQCQDRYTAAINIDTVDNVALKARSVNSLTVKDFSQFAQTRTTSVSENKLSDNPQLDFVRKVALASAEGNEEIQKALQNASRYNEEYANNALAKNLQWMAKLIKGNLNSKIYYTTLNGFDTHNNQLNEHAKQLTTLNDAVYSFYKDMKENNLLSRVTLVVFSEFGRRVQQNDSGTDHGTAGPMLIIGGNTKGKKIGNNSNLADLDNGDLKHETDFRSIYATLLQEKFQFDVSQIGITQGVIKNIF